MTSPWNEARIPLVTSLVTTVDVQRRPNASPKVWWVPISYEPPMVALSLKPETDTWLNIEETGCWVLHVPPSDLAKKVLHTAKPLPRGENELDDVGLAWEWLSRSSMPAHGLPYLPYMPWFACMADAAVVTGDHVLVTGEVVEYGGFDPAKFEGFDNCGFYRFGVEDVLLHRGRNAFQKIGGDLDVLPY